MHLDELENSNTKSSTPRTSECILTSWKVSEFAYRKVEVVGLKEDADIPTLARGLFTAADMEWQGKGEQKRERIVARGYDKFFNVDEMRWTKRPSLEAHSTAPYLLTFKENGCIILISALTSDQLVVCSKHSVGDRDDVELSHAKAGEAWVDRHLERVGRKRQELAKELWHRRCTAVAELCDDSFEEHVLAYAPSRTGLHLHGLNHNIVHFSTEPMDVVASFAQAWGFIPPRWKTFHSLKTLFAFTDQVSETGSWEGEAIEGDWRELTRTMIRSQKKWAQDNKFDLDDALSGKGIVASREVFLRYLNSEEGKKRLGELDPGSERKTSEGGKRSMDERPFTHTVVVPVAVPGCGKTILSIALADLLSQSVANSQPDDTSSCMKGAALDTPLRVSHVQADNMTTKKTGPAFLQAVTAELSEGKNVVIADRNNHLLKHRRELVDEVRKWEEKVHKTSLDKARGYAQEQKKRGSAAAPLAAKNDVLRDEVAAPRVRLVALPWDLDDLALNAVHRLCSDRITQRGDNHQSLRADPRGASGSSDHEDVLWKFLDDWQSFQAGPLDDAEADEADLAFDESIRMGVDVEEEGNLKQAFEAISQILGVRLGDAQLGPEGKSRRINDALKRAKEYKVDVLKPARAIHSQVARSQAPSKAPRYYGISVELNSFSALKQRLVRHAGMSALHAEALDMLEKMHRENRIVKTPHITLVHSSELHKNQGAEESAKSEAARRKWKRYEEMCSGGTGSSAGGDAADAPDSQRIGKAPPEFDIVLDRLAWQSGRAMAFGVCKTGKERVFSKDMPDFEEVQCGLRIASSVMIPEEGRGEKEDGEGRASSESTTTTTTTTIMQDWTPHVTDWTPHVTVGTANESIRPFEAHAVLREADENEKKERRREERCKVLYLGEESIRIRGRLQGMNR
ncbi:hypothetical protein CBOM_01726 [Ceraceosorus bombacis]|uniref:tRNA ligase n=1 Tax=Ceraceosorus bombacis TaxID=401625 RepID=A0A0P1BEG5_9BASI|nr:hypothetical protein CBOM_01726 [Ceraceosorus bombacis]